MLLSRDPSQNPNPVCRCDGTRVEIFEGNRRLVGRKRRGQYYKRKNAGKKKIIYLIKKNNNWKV